MSKWLNLPTWKLVFRGTVFFVYSALFLGPLIVAARLEAAGDTSTSQVGMLAFVILTAELLTIPLIGWVEDEFA